jgi:hypothetical protein
MTTSNNSNFNISTINNISAIGNIFSNVTINNSIKIARSDQLTNDKILNQNAGIYLKDINSIGSGNFYKIHVNSFSNDSPTLYFNNNEIIDSSNLLNELENILQYQTLDASNIMITGGYLNFSNGSNPNNNQGENGVGIRYNSNNMVQFKNYNTGWIDLVDILQHDQFSELKDVDVDTNPLENNQYITYNSGNSKFVNSTLAIINDPNPTLGGDLNVGDYLLRFGDITNRFVFNSSGIIDNNLLVLKNNTSMTNDCNYIEINNADITGTVNPSISAQSTYNMDTGININALNAGTIELNATQSNIYANSNNLIISNNLIVNNDLIINSNLTAKTLIVTGYSISSIYRTSTKPGGYNPNETWDMPVNTETILFNFNSNSSNGSYFSNIGAGIDGQKLNLVFNNNSDILIDVSVFFGENKLLVGSGFANGLKFDTNGQSSSLMYLGEDIQCWQALNTGATLF